MLKVRALFLSDLHLFSSKCNTKELLWLLNNVQYQHLVLVGDIIDFTYCRRFDIDKDFLHLAIIRKIIHAIQNPKIKVTYVIGNHESDLLRATTYNKNQNFNVVDTFIYHTNNKEKYLVEHGHNFSHVSNEYISRKPYKLWKWLRNLLLKYVDKKIHYAWTTKTKAFLFWVQQYEKNMLCEVSNIEKSLQSSVHSNYRLNGIITGHSHSPCSYKQTIVDDLQNSNFYTVINCGDFVHNNSFVIENNTGELELMSYRNSTVLRNYPLHIK